jgi:hypothetical protein
MRKLASISALVAIISGLAVAQGVRVETDAKSSSKKVISIVTSENGKKRTYRKVIQDGKVIEESGDPSLLKDTGLDARGLLRKARRDGGAKTKHKSRRIVIRDGKKVIDETTGDGKDVDFDFDFDFEVDVDVQKKIRDAMKKFERLHRRRGVPDEHDKRKGRRLRREREDKKDIVIDEDDSGRHRMGIEVLPDFLEGLDVHLEGALEKGLRGLRDLHLEIPDIEVDLDFDTIMDEVHRHIPDIDDIIEDVRIHIPQLKAHLRGLHEPHPRARSKAPKVERDTADLEHQIQELMQQAEELQRELNRLIRDETRSLRRGHRTRL